MVLRSRCAPLFSGWLLRRSTCHRAIQQLHPSATTQTPHSMGASTKFIARIAVLATSAGAFSLPPMALPLGASSSNNGIRMAADATAGASALESGKLQRVAVVGGGPAGALMALYLSRSGGFEVDLFETSAESKIAGPTSRSWNVILFDRACDALEGGGFDLQREVGDLVITTAGSVRHNAKKKVGGGPAVGTKSICRGDLAKALLNKADRSPNINVHFDCSFSTMDVNNGVATYERGNGETFESAFDMLVGADGVNSRVREALQDHSPDFTVREREGIKTYKVFEIPIMGMEGAEESWKSYIHSSNSKKGSVVASPRSDGVASAALMLPRGEKMTFETLMTTTQDVRDYFGSNHPGLYGPEGPDEDVARNLLEQRPKLSRTIYCTQLNFGSVVLIGDAAHAMQASLGQGVNCALEDCQVLAQLLAAETRKTGAAKADRFPEVLDAYNQRRLGDVHAACELSEIGSALGIRKTLTAQLTLTLLLNKTLGRLFPKIFRPPSLFAINSKDEGYGAVLRGFKREAAVAKGVGFASVALIFGGVARRVILRF